MSMIHAMRSFHRDISHWRNRMCRVVFLGWFLDESHRSFMSSFAASQSFVVISVKTRVLGSLLRESDSRFLCRCSGCCHDIGGGCSVCACVYVCMPVCTPHEASFGFRLRSPWRVWSLVWLTCSSHQSSRCQKLHCTVRTSLHEQSLARELPIQTEPNQSSCNPAWLWPPVDCPARPFPMPAA